VGLRLGAVCSARYHLLLGPVVHPHDDVARGVVGDGGVHAHGTVLAIEQHERARRVEGHAADVVRRRAGVLERSLHALAHGRPDVVARLLKMLGQRVEHGDVLLVHTAELARGHVHHAGARRASADVHAHGEAGCHRRRSGTDRAGRAADRRVQGLGPLRQKVQQCQQLAAHGLKRGLRVAQFAKLYSQTVIHGKLFTRDAVRGKRP